MAHRQVYADWCKFRDPAPVFMPYAGNAVIAVVPVRWWSCCVPALRGCLLQLHLQQAWHHIGWWGRGTCGTRLSTPSVCLSVMTESWWICGQNCPSGQWSSLPQSCWGLTEGFLPLSSRQPEGELPSHTVLRVEGLRVCSNKTSHYQRHFLRGVSVDSRLSVTHVNFFCVSFSAECSHSGELSKAVWSRLRCLRFCQHRCSSPSCGQCSASWTAVVNLIFYLAWKGNGITCCYLNSYGSLESLHEQLALCVSAEFVSASCEDEARVDLLFYFGVVWVKCT